MREGRTTDVLEISRINDRRLSLKLVCPYTKDITAIIWAYGHTALLIFQLAAMLTFCQIIRKLDLRIFYFNTITDQISSKKPISGSRKMHACVLRLSIVQTEHAFLHSQGHVRKNG